MKSSYKFLVLFSLLKLSVAAVAAEDPVSSMPVLAVPGLGAVPPVQCVKWDYYNRPIDTKGSGPVHWAYGTVAAFDGYPSSVKLPYIRAYWNCDAPADGKPAYVIIDYKRSVAVTRYVHYYNFSEKYKAFKNVEIFTSDDGEHWISRQILTDLQRDVPQVLGIDRPTSARYYKIEIKSLTDDCEKLHSYEIETYYGATVGNVTANTPAVQGEPLKLFMHILSPDAAMRGATIRIISPKGSIDGPSEIKVPSVPKGGSSVPTVVITPLQPGPTPIRIELYDGGYLIDKRTYTIRAKPKLVFADVLPAGAIVAKRGDAVSVKGTITNNGLTPAAAVKVMWLGVSKMVGDLAVGKSASFQISAKAPESYSQGALVATASGLTKTMIRRGVICPTDNQFSVKTPSATNIWKCTDGVAKMSTKLAGAKGPVSGTLSLLREAFEPENLLPIGTGSSHGLAAILPGGVLRVKFGAKAYGRQDQQLSFELVPDDPHPLAPSITRYHLQFAVDKPKVLFRPQVDLFTAEHGRNCQDGGLNVTHSPTRMLCAQTDNGSVSLVPDTDNFIWWINDECAMRLDFKVELADYDPLGEGRWRPLGDGPMAYKITMPVLKGDWWASYRYVVKDIFKFEQARQWAMPITQMQMIDARYLMRAECWSELFQTVRTFPNVDFFYNFYGTTYTLPALYSWYLVSDDETARVKADKVANWLISVQQKDGAMAGGWFSQYSVGGNPPNYTMVGQDQAGNHWMLPHSTGSSVKTLLWYWEASGKTNQKVFDAAKRGCDMLIAKQGDTGAWPYAYDLDGKVISDLSDAGQIWCAWSLWKMGQFTGEEKYKTAALKYKDFFTKMFLNNHRYYGYWEDVCGSEGQVSAVTRSFEGYEPAIATMVYSEMGDKERAIELGKDAAVWTWTRVISTRQYETSYGETIEQGSAGPSQAQSPMVGVSMEHLYEITGDPLFNDLSGAVKSINFCADPDQAYGMVATGAWDDATTGAVSPPYENVRPLTKPNGPCRGVWTEWQTAQFAWLSLEWLVREANLRAPQYVKIDTNTYRGTVLGLPGRVKMPEEKCDVSGIDHYDINWTGYTNDQKYVLIVMNHQEKTTVNIRPHEAHLDCLTLPPKILVGSGKDYHEVKVVKHGVQYVVDIPAKGTAILIWDRIR